VNVAWDLPARTADAVAVGERAELWAVEVGCDSGVALKLTLILEELATNTVKYGYCGECDSPIRIALAYDGARLTLTYEDEAPAFDPMKQIAATVPGDAPVGGFGLHMIKGLAESMVYTRDGQRNVVRIVLVRQSV
jgi:serine/threonine-protein kinase RsbW